MAVRFDRVHPVLQVTAAVSSFSNLEVCFRARVLGLQLSFASADKEAGKTKCYLSKLSWL
jgi:hypothetical protein